MMRPLTITALFCCCLLATAPTGVAEEWTRFRGPNGTGIVSDVELPTSWEASDYRFDIELPGIGHSSPVITGDRLFVTSAIEQKGKDGGAIRHLLCLDADTGKEQWRRTMGFAPSHKHSKNSYASSTPCTDGERVYVAFADDKRHVLSAWTVTGDEVWRKDLGAFSSQHGQGTSPIIYKDLVILPNDQMGPSSVLAFDRKTGEIVWTAERKFRRTSYSTPMVLTAEGQPDQIITISGAMGVTSLDPKTGKTNWSSGEVPLRTVASPIVAGGLIFISCGSGGQGKYLAAIDPSLDLKAGESRVVYEQKRILPYVPTPVVIDERLCLWTDQGVLRCLEPETGTTLWTFRVGGNFSGSPIAVGDHLYAISESGEVVVVNISGEEPQVVSRIELGDRSHATPVVANGNLYLRSFRRLMCLPGQSKS